MIVRVVKDKNNPYVMINKTPLDDPRLSFKAKGILAYLLSKPDHWQVRVSDLANHAKDGRDAIRSGLRELREAGYATLERKRDENGAYTDGCYTIYEVPPQTGFPSMDNPDVENPEASNNDCSKDNDKPEDSNESSCAPKKRTRKRSELDCLKSELVTHFTEKSGLPKPPTGTKGECSAAGKLWWQPLLRIAACVDRDLERAHSLVEWALDHADSQNLTISSPASIEKIAIGEQGRRVRSNGRPPRSATRSSGPSMSQNLAWIQEMCEEDAANGR